ncbi:hypothetical protein ZI90_005015 [Salmonella enterica subsp. enterica]|nr:hypothetical protein [Salmonella enterica subsp. enterica]EDR6623000.1 hypothetical protein [Salmonella enterica subsp. enterica]
MGSCAAPSAKGDDKFITTDYLQQCPGDVIGGSLDIENYCTIRGPLEGAAWKTEIFPR